MIENGFLYIASLIFIAGTISIIEKKYPIKIFDLFPSIVIIYALVMLFASLNLWSQNREISDTYSSMKDALLPSMIFLMLLEADMHSIMKLGKKMLITFFLATLSIMTGFIISFLLLQSFLSQDAWLGLAALSGSWVGGTGNMIAIQGALNVPNSMMGNVMIADSVNYTLWVMLLLALVPFANRFNLWSKSDTSTIDEVSKKIAMKIKDKEPSASSLLMLLGISFLVNITSTYMASFLPTTNFMSSYTWAILITTVFVIL